MKLGPKAARRVASIEAEARRSTAAVRLLAVGMLELGMLAGIPVSAILLQESAAASGRYLLGVAALACLILVAPVISRGSGAERILALLLCPFPVLVGLVLIVPVVR